MLTPAAAQRNDDARRYLSRYLALAPKDDYEASFALGEALSALNQKGAATASYEKALRTIDSAPKPNFQMRLVRANILQRLDLPSRAAAAAYAVSHGLI